MGGKDMHLNKMKIFERQLNSESASNFDSQFDQFGGYKYNPSIYTQDVNSNYAVRAKKAQNVDWTKPGAVEPASKGP